MPAYNAERTIEKTWREVVAQEIVDLVVVVDDASRDATVERARMLDKIVVHTHPSNRGYGANQKTCYKLALQHGADIVIMVHPDYQYTPKLIPAMAGLVASGLYACVLASRILGGQAVTGGMPWWRYVSNRGLTLAGNVLLGTKFSEFHTGVPGILTRIAGAVASRRELRRLCFRQPTHRRNGLAGVRDRRGLLSDELRARRIVDQFPPQRTVRVRLPGHRAAVPSGEVGTRP